MLTVELVIVAVLIVVNGVLAMSELAIVSARPARLKALADAGSRGAHVALALTTDPGRFLSTVQIGITLVGIVAGTFSGATLAGRFSLWLQEMGLRAGTAEPVAYGAVVGAITYLSLIVGELVPKQIALRNAERVAVAMAPAMRVLSKIGAPVVWLLNISQTLLLNLLGLGGEGERSVTDEEIRTLVAEAESAGVLEPEERSMIAGIMRLADRNVRGLMTPRRDVDWIDMGDSQEEITRTIMESGHSRLPVMDGSEENVVGVVYTKDVLNAVLSAGSFDLKELVRPAPVVHDTMDALVALARLKESPVPVAIVHDEYGHFEGIVTTADILEAIAGSFHSEDEDEKVVERADGSFLIPGSLPADEMADALGLRLPAERDYQTMAGFVLSVAKTLPATGDTFDALGWRFEVVDLDGSRIDKVLASRIRKRAHRQV